MLTNFFGKSKPITFLVTFLLFFCLFFTAIFSGKITSNYFETLPMLLVLTVVVIFINIKNNLSFDNLYVTLFFLFLIGFFPDSFKINTVFYSNLTLLFFLRKTYSLQSENQLFKKLFDAGLWLGISFILEPFSVVFIALLYLSIYLHQHLTVRTLLIPILGFLTPLFFYFTYCFWFDKVDLFFNLLDWFTYYDFVLYQQYRFLFPIIILCVFIFFSILIKTPKALSVKNDFRKNWILILFNFICATILLITLKERNGSEFLYLFFPTAIIIANLVEIYENKWFSDIFILFFLISSFVMCII